MADAAQDKDWWGSVSDWWKNTADPYIKNTVVGEALAKDVGVKYLANGGRFIAGFVGKKIPVLSLGVGGYLAWDRLKRGDYRGAMMEAASGIVSCFPGPGTALGVAIDGSIAYQDYKLLKNGEDPYKNLPVVGAIPAKPPSGIILQGEQSRPENAGTSAQPAADATAQAASGQQQTTGVAPAASAATPQPAAANDEYVNKFVNLATSDPNDPKLVDSIKAIAQGMSEQDRKAFVDGLAHYDAKGKYHADNSDLKFEDSLAGQKGLLSQTMDKRDPRAQAIRDVRNGIRANMTPQLQDVWNANPHEGQKATASPSSPKRTHRRHVGQTQAASSQRRPGGHGHHRRELRDQAPQMIAAAGTMPIAGPTKAKYGSEYRTEGPGQAVSPAPQANIAAADNPAAKNGWNERDSGPSVG